MVRRRLVVTAFACLAGLPGTGFAQQPPDDLTAGIARVDSGDYRMGIMTLNGVVASLTLPSVSNQAQLPTWTQSVASAFVWNTSS